MIERFTFDRLRTTLLFVAIATAGCLMPAQHDTWWLLRAGQDMWATRHVLLTDTYSHTVYGAAWPNHEWLSQLIFYAIYAVGGLPLLTLASAAIVTAAWAIVWAETRGPAKIKFLMTAFVLATATTTWSLRAQVLSLLLVVSTVALLRRRHYAWLPLLFWAWANLHGAVLLGVLLLAASLCAAVLEDIKRLPRLPGTAALCLVATALTPLGWHFWLDMPQSLGRIRQLGIDEWAPPSSASAALLPFWITVGRVGGARCRARPCAAERCWKRETGAAPHPVRVRAGARAARVDGGEERAAVPDARPAGRGRADVGGARCRSSGESTAASAIERRAGRCRGGCGDRRGRRLQGPARALQLDAAACRVADCARSLRRQRLQPRRATKAAT